MQCEMWVQTEMDLLKALRRKYVPYEQAHESSVGCGRADWTHEPLFFFPPMLTRAPILQLQLQPQKANKKLWNYNILLLGSQPHLTAALRMAPSTKVKPHTASGPALPRAECVPWILAAAELHEWTSTILASSCTDSLQDSGLHPYDGHSNPQKHLLSTKKATFCMPSLHDVLGT